MVIRMTLEGSSVGGAEEIIRGERRSVAKRASEVALSTCTLFGTDSFGSRIPRVRGEAGMVLCSKQVYSAQELRVKRPGLGESEARSHDPLIPNVCDRITG